MKRKFVILSGVMGVGILLLAGCGSGAVGKRGENGAVSAADEAAESVEGTQTDSAVLSEESRDQPEPDEGQTAQDQPGLDTGQTVQDQPGLDTGQIGESEPGASGGEADDSPKEAPRLPKTGRQLADFVPDGWEVWDSVELDFNEDGTTDYVGVLQAVMTDEDGAQVYQLEYPRILFGIASDEAEGYRLDFQDENVIRTRDEGGVFGDPYQSLTAEGASFTTHTYGGSAWRWSEDYTYTYREGVWWLASSETTYGYGDYITDYEKNDWKSGVGLRKKRSSSWGPMEENVEQIENADWDSIGYDLEYEVPLDKQMTLEQAGKRWWLAPDRVTDWEVKEKIFAEDVKFPEKMTELPDGAYIEYCDEARVLYTFHTVSDTDRYYYLVMYGLQDKVLSVLAETESAIAYPKFYDGKIYYSTDIVEKVTRQTAEDGAQEQEQNTETEIIVGVRLNRMALDGSGKEVIYEYRYPKETSDTLENSIPYLSLLYEIGGGEIIAEVYMGGEPHLFYRMQTDGSGQELIGQVPK